MCSSMYMHVPLSYQDLGYNMQNRTNTHGNFLSKLCTSRISSSVVFQHLCLCTLLNSLLKSLLFCSFVLAWTYCVFLQSFCLKKLKWQQTQMHTRAVCLVTQWVLRAARNGTPEGVIPIRWMPPYIDGFFSSLVQHSCIFTVIAAGSQAKGVHALFSHCGYLSPEATESWHLPLCVGRQAYCTD